jgi:hypothetical protein
MLTGEILIVERECIRYRFDRLKVFVEQGSLMQRGSIAFALCYNQVEWLPAILELGVDRADQR